jgi:hypothetical protein
MWRQHAGESAGSGDAAWSAGSYRGSNGGRDATPITLGVTVDRCVELGLVGRLVPTA